MLEKRVVENLRKSKWSCKQIASQTGIPVHFLSQLHNGRILEGTSRDYTLDSDLTQSRLKQLDQFFKPYVSEQNKLKERVENSQSERNIILNKSNYRSKSVLGGAEYTAQYNNMLTPVKFLIYDIEISPILGWTYSQYNTNILRVAKEQTLMSFAYMILEVDGSKTVLDGDYSTINCYTLADFDYNEEALVKKMHELFEECQIIVGFNSKQFDDKHATKYFIKHKLDPIAPIKQIDLLREWKKVAKLTGNHLESINEYLFNERKTEERVGDLWYDCMVNQDQESYKLLKEYNKQDVVLTYNILKELLCYMKDTPANLSLLMNHPLACPRCGFIDDFEEAGFYYSNVGRYNQYKCKKCGSYLHGRYQEPGSAHGIRPLQRDAVFQPRFRNERCTLAHRRRRTDCIAGEKRGIAVAQRQTRTRQKDASTAGQHDQPDSHPGTYRWHSICDTKEKI